jgi:hypothetical protein
MRRSILLIILALAGLAAAATALGDPGGNGKGKGRNKPDKPGNTTFRFTFTNTDNGSCADGSTANWATLNETRTYKVRKTKAGFRLTRYDAGTFVTRAGRSPGACETGSRHGQTVAAGVHGHFHGTIVGTITGGTFNPNATCPADCAARSTFITTFFGPSAVYSCDISSTDCRFNFQYTAPAQKLRFHHWQDRGTGASTLLHEVFRGDIANS